MNKGKKNKIDTSLFASRWMGKLVVVTHVLHRRGEKQKAFWEPEKLEKPRSGWVTGLRWCSNGSLARVSVDGVFGGGGTYNEYIERERFPAFLVAFWPTMKPVKVLPEHCGFHILESDPEPYLQKATLSLGEKDPHEPRVPELASR